jgi:hypothetical protein
LHSYRQLELQNRDNESRRKLQRSIECVVVVARCIVAGCRCRCRECTPQHGTLHQVVE